MTPNAQTHLSPESGARHERTLEAVRCSAWFGAARIRHPASRPAFRSAVHLLTRCRWQTLDSFHPGSDPVLGTGVSCMMEGVCGAVASRVTSHDRRFPMSLPAAPCDIIPEQTIQVARAAFPK